MKFDEVFTYIGEYGRYHKLVTIPTCVLIIANAFSNISTVFISGAMDHYNCTSPDDFSCQQATGGCWRSNQTMILPPDDEGTLLIDESKCRRYADDNETELTTCEYGWTYDRSRYKSTIVSEFDLVCENGYKLSLAQSLYFGGYLIGSILFGILCDYFGRKRAVFLGYTLLLLMGILTGLSMSYWFYAVFRFISGITDIGSVISILTYVTELVAPSKRAIAATFFYIFWCIGIMVLAVVAYFIRSWDTLMFVNSALSPLLLLYYFVPESPRWLLVKGKQEEAKHVLRRIANGNGVSNLPDGILENLEVDSES